ncbi:hypothetical protein L6164_028540 [Bauhinia variegata]|uniref:Uncharacterized protein n=1 Tax=Bauhinia variegata TaxID=167791 RepID=A0ACB9L6J2_BAUVA|nr:hypothetical protein L6164_028540 [Bauhinia variegata]
MGCSKENFAEPLSPMAQKFSSSALHVYILGVFEFDVPIDELQIVSLLRDLFLSTNPRFSSVIVIRDKDGGKRWSKVEVKLEEHIFIPKFPEGLSLDSYDKYFGKYLSRIAMQESPPNKPSWKVHIIKYPTSNASGGSIAFRIHYSIADGFSIMSLLLSSLRRADNPSLPLTFPSRQRSKPEFGNKRSSLRLPGFFNSVLDFAWNLLNSTEVDDKTPIRSGDEGVEFHPFVLSHLTFAITQLKEIKNNLGDEVTINDVITGVIVYGTRLYMQNVDYESSKANASACVVLNTRKVGYQLEDMVKCDAMGAWGNRIVFMPVPINKLEDGQNPLDYVWGAHKMIKKKRHPLALFINDQLSKTTRKFKGMRNIRNSSAMISNMTGPVEQMALANHPIKGLYFNVPGIPKSLMFTIVSYMGMLRVTITTEESFINEKKLTSCLNNAFESIFNAARATPPSKI